MKIPISSIEHGGYSTQRFFSHPDGPFQDTSTLGVHFSTAARETQASTGPCLFARGIVFEKKSRYLILEWKVGMVRGNVQQE